MGTTMRRVTLASDGRSEAWLRDFLLRHPEVLPAGDIDPAFADPIPIARELNTQAGPIDAVFATRDGGLVVVECKLWRNPQARREVVGQILDYAKELARWRYEDLQREVARARRNSAAAGIFPGCTATDGKGDAVFDEVARRHPGLVQADFIDAVSRNLRTGRFLLLIAGDGIREGTETIVRFLAESAGLRFTFGLVEMAGYQAEDGDLLVQPRLLARTIEIERVVVRVVETAGSGAGQSDDAAGRMADEELVEEAAGTRGARDPALLDADKAFWKRFAEHLRLDDPSQPPPRRGGLGWARLPIAPGCWISVYRARSDGTLGVFAPVALANADRVFGPRDSETRRAIEAELAPVRGDDASLAWRSNDRHAWVGISWPDRFDPPEEADARHIARLGAVANAFVNAIRPRVLRVQEGGEGI